MPSDEPDLVLEHAGVRTTLLRGAELSAISHSFSKVPPEEFIEAVTLAPALSWDGGQGRRPGTFEIHGRDWWLDVSDPGNREYLLVVIAAAVLADALQPSLQASVGWVAQVLPSVLTVRSVHRDGAGPHLDLVRRADPQIPADLVDCVNRQDFADFVAAVDAAPAVLPLPAGGVVTVAR
jgi:hypothetical protein